MTVYRVTARSGGSVWELECHGYGVTQSERLVDAKEMAADYIETLTGVPVFEHQIDLAMEVNML